MKLQLTEDEIREGLKKGSETAFRELVRRFESGVYNAALSIVQNREDAEDVAQEVFIEAYRSVAAFRGDASLRTWLYRIAVNRSLDLLRHRKRAKRGAPTRSLNDDSGPGPILDVPHFDHPGVQLERQEQARLVFAAIDQLPERQKAAFVLLRVEGLSQKEAAQALEISEGALESLISRAQLSLRRMLEEYYDAHYRRKPNAGSSNPQTS